MGGGSGPCRETLSLHSRRSVALHISHCLAVLARAAGEQATRQQCVRPISLWEAGIDIRSRLSLVWAYWNDDYFLHAFSGVCVDICWWILQSWIRSEGCGLVWGSRRRTRSSGYLVHGEVVALEGTVHTGRPECPPPGLYEPPILGDITEVSPYTGSMSQSHKFLVLPWSRSFTSPTTPLRLPAHRVVISADPGFIHVAYHQSAISHLHARAMLLPMNGCPLGPLLLAAVLLWTGVSARSKPDLLQVSRI